MSSPVPSFDEPDINSFGVEQVYHPTFNHPSADIVFVSVDGIRFRLHERHLSSLAEGLSAEGFLVNVDEAVELSETAATLEILFQFVAPRKFPNLADLTFGLLADVAEAAEKYVVYAAMAICSIRMLGHTEDYPVDVLAYALKHDYEEIANVAAKAASCHPLRTVIHRIHPVDTAQWTLYYESFREVFRHVRRLYLPWGMMNIPRVDKKTRYMCAEWYSAVNIAILRLEGLENFRTLQEELQFGSTIESDMRKNHDSRCKCDLYLDSFEKVYSLISQKIERIPLFFHEEIEDEEELSEEDCSSEEG